MESCHQVVVQPRVVGSCRVQIGGRAKSAKVNGRVNELLAMFFAVYVCAVRIVLLCISIQTLHITI